MDLNQLDVPLCVDLDGTLVATDTLWESILLLLKKNILQLLVLPWWVIQGRAIFKHKIAQQVTLEVANLPYRENVLLFLQQEKKSGRSIVLATAAHTSIAQAVFTHLKLFNEVIASDAHTNMKGITKRDALIQRFGNQGYDYMGDSIADLPIFQTARQPFLVAPTQQLLKQIQCTPQQILTVPTHYWQTFFKAIRPHQWLKNLLIFLPLLLSHQFFNIAQWQEVFLAFITFNLAASSGYILNDLMDLTADRAHPTKKYRPFAAGLLSIPTGLILFMSLLGASLLMSLWWLSGYFTGLIGLYLLLTISYSFYLKRKLVVDVLVLASLYTHRILAGSVAVNAVISSWFLAFAMFIFTSLAFLKRYVELLQLTDEKAIKNRGYEITDIEMVASMGPSSGYLAVLVFALYINSDKVSILYPSPFFLWLICPLLLYWISRVWFLARRGEMFDDPVQYALTDTTSWFIVVTIIILMLLAKFA
ncbi:MAG: UbiA family prenyltransferase [Thioploca sp.]|nr:UbiA family prenyltransferase [Thioploca sp.]